MPLRHRKRSAASGSAEVEQASETKSQSSEKSKETISDNSNNESSEENEVEELMRDNLDLMLDIVLRIREDRDFAANIYAECPRLQHLLDQNPDLRPIFEDPYLVRINFEKVYRDAGGTLPEDKPPPKGLLATIVSHPLFKVFRFLLVIKKLVSCITGGGIGMIKGCFRAMFSDPSAEMLEGAHENQGDQAGADIGDDDDHDTSPENQENKDALNRAADHMEDPEIQEYALNFLVFNVVLSARLLCHSPYVPSFTGE